MVNNLITRHNINSLFTFKSFNLLIENKYTNEYIKFASNICSFQKQTNIDILRLVYKKMIKSCKNEYFYKNTFLNQFILKHRTKYVPPLIFEYQIEHNIADIFLIKNDSFYIYEIKSDLDNFNRLFKQIDCYYKCSPLVSVIVSEKKLNSLLELNYNKNLGIFVCKSNKIYEYRKPKQYYGKLDRKYLFNLIYKKEYSYFVKKMHLKNTNFSDFAIYNAFYSIISKIEIKKFYQYVVEIISNRFSIDSKFILSTPKELRTIACKISHDKIKKDKFINFLNNFYKGDYKCIAHI